MTPSRVSGTPSGRSDTDAFGQTFQTEYALLKPLRVRRRSCRFTFYAKDLVL